VVASILSPLSLYRGNRKMKLPLLHNTWIHTPEWHFGNLVVAPSDGCPVTAPHFTSTQALRSRRMSSASKSLNMPRSHLRPPSLQSWLCGSTKEPDDVVVNCRKPRELGAHSTPIPLMTWPPRPSGSVLVLWSKPTKPHVQTLVVSRYPAPTPPWF
jgi:hypothetical protein